MYNEGCHASWDNEHAPRLIVESQDNKQQHYVDMKQIKIRP